MTDTTPKPSLWTENLPIVTTINPKLAGEIGLNESIVLLQIAYWISRSKHLKDGKWWIYKSLQEMKSEWFEYWSVPTISRVINTLIEKGLLFKTDEHNKRKNDRTQWFALNLDGIAKLKSVQLIFQNETTIFQNEKAIFQNETTLPEESKNKPKDSSVDKPQDAELEVMTELVKKELKQYSTTETIAKALLGRLKGKQAKYNLDTPITAQDLLDFVAWWDLKKDRNGMSLTRPKNLGSLRSNIPAWQDSRVQKENPKIVSNYVPSQSIASIPEITESDRLEALALIQASKAKKEEIS